MRAPTKLYWLELETVGKLRYRQSGGGKFSILKSARDRQRYLAGQGIRSTLYECVPVWTPVVDTEPSSA